MSLTEQAGKVVSTTVDALKSTPALLIILVFNVIILAGFALTLHEISQSVERRDVMLEKCIK